MTQTLSKYTQLGTSEYKEKLHPETYKTYKCF